MAEKLIYDENHAVLLFIILAKAKMVEELL